MMRFHLVYSGPLSASGNKSKLEEVSAIRAKLAPQLEQLWDTHHSLQILLQEGALPPSNVGRVTAMNSRGRISPRQMVLDGMGGTDLLANFKISSREFLPLVRKSLDLNCEIDILFLRQQDPGSLISQGGDIDNRVKTLLDALRNPDSDEEKKEPTNGDTLIYTLMESDTLVSRLNIDTDRLLFSETEKPNEVHLVIEVTLKVLKVGSHNMCLI